MKEIVSATSQDTVEALVDRDQWDRPLILPPSGHKPKCKARSGKGGGCFCMEGYVRVSTMAETLSDSFGLNRWQQMNVVKGLANRPDLVNAARVATSKKDLYEIVDLAGTIGENDVAARNGTTMHRFFEMVDNGQPLPVGLPDNINAMIDAYQKAAVDLRPLESEVFVVQDAIKCGGTYDKRYELLVDKPSRGISAGECLIGDVKTGQNLEYLALKTCMQVSIYASGSVYDLDGNRRRVDCNRDWGVLIWCPWVEEAKDAECQVRWLDLKQGRIAVKEAIRVRGLRSLKADQLMPQF